MKRKRGPLCENYSEFQGGRSRSFNLGVESCVITWLFVHEAARVSQEETLKGPLTCREAEACRREMRLGAARTAHLAGATAGGGTPPWRERTLLLTPRLPPGPS